MMLSFTVRVPSVNGFSTTLLCAALPLILCSCGSEPVRQEVSGTVETDQVRVASRYGGRVKAVLAAEGEALAPGRVIVELEAAELGARLDQARAFLAELVSGPRPEEISVARSEWEALVAEVDQARADARRADDLFTQKTISTTEREVTATKLRRLEKSVEAAKSRLDLLRAGTRAERLTQARAQNQIQALQMVMIFILPSVFFSGFIFPRETMPKIFQLFGALLPATYYIELQRAIVLRGASLADFWSHLVVLTIMGVAVFSLCALRLKQRVS